MLLNRFKMKNIMSSFGNKTSLIIDNVQCYCKVDSCLEMDILYSLGRDKFNSLRMNILEQTNRWFQNNYGK